MKFTESKIDKLVLVVHGVGDPAPGETLGIFARSLAEDHRPMADRQTTVWLPEKSAHPHFVKTFPTHIRNITHVSENVELAEVFWGDVSRVWRGLPGAIVGLFQILFGLRYVAYVAADQPGGYAFWLKRLGLYSSRILHGPVLAVTFVLAILTVAISGTQMLWTDSYKAAIWTQMVLAGCCLFAMTSSSIGWHLTRSRVLERFWFWVNVTAMFVAGLMLIKTQILDSAFPEVAVDGIRPGLIWYCRVLVVLLGSLWFAEIIVLIGIGMCWLGAIANPRAHRPALHLALLLPALSVGIWGQVLPMVWLSANDGMKKWLHMPELEQLFEEAIPLMGVQFLMCAVLAVVVSVIGVRFIRWRSRHQVSDYENGARAPRLIVHGGIQIMLAVCTILGVLLVLGIGLLEARGMEYDRFWFGRLMAESNKYAMAVLLPGSVVLVFLLPRLRPVFDIVLDVVNHFYFRATNLHDTLEDEDEFDINDTTFDQGTLFFARRDMIHQRMKRILLYYRDELEGRPELVIVSHSQGTMVAIEVLNDPELAWLNERFTKVSLVTMGSPFSNLYQHYFNHCYPSLDRPFWSNLRKRMDRWVNVFRIDDPVGTEIGFPDTIDMRTRQSYVQRPLTDSELPQTSDAEPALSKTRYSNHPVGCRGHVNYWNDSEVLDVLRAELFKTANEAHHSRAA